MSETKTAKRGRKAVLTDSARKRRRREINAKNNKNRIYIGMEYDRWNELKNILRVESHAEVAKILLDRYEERAIQADRAVSISDATHFGTPRNFKATSTPVLSKLATLHIPDVSYISSSDYDQEKILQRYYSKKGGNWTVNKVKEPKRYEFMPTLLRKILMARLEDNVGMNQKVFLELDDPRRLSATIAPVPPPPSSELLRDKVSRFSREDPDRTIDYDWQS